MLKTNKWNFSPSVWNFARISLRSHLVCAVYGGSGALDWATWSTRPPVCRWHPGDRILSTTWRQRSTVSYINLFGRCCRLDTIKSVEAQHRQDGVALVCHCTLSNSATVHPASSWTSLRQFCVNISRSGYIHWCRFIWTHTCTENNGVVFCCSATAADRRSVPAVDRLQITDRVIGT